MELEPWNPRDDSPLGRGQLQFHMAKATRWVWCGKDVRLEDLPDEEIGVYFADAR